MNTGSVSTPSLSIPRLLWAHAFFRRTSAVAYWQLVGQKPSSQEWEASIFAFLNAWQCRITRDSRTRKHIVCSIREVWNELSPDAYDCNLLTFRDIPHNLFDELSEVGWSVKGGGYRTLGATATGKIMHVLRPDVFVMWDAAIRKSYGFSGGSADYERFMRTMATAAGGLVSRFRELCGDRRQSLPAVICRLVGCDHPQPATLSKLLDELNWMTITCHVRLPSA